MFIVSILPAGNRMITKQKAVKEKNHQEEDIRVGLRPSRRGELMDSRSFRFANCGTHKGELTTQIKQRDKRSASDKIGRVISSRR